MTPIRLLLDEMISPWLVNHLWQAGIDAWALRDRGLLQADDHVVWRLGQDEHRAVVTINEKHFRKFINPEHEHHGLVAIPEGGTRAEQLSYVSAATSYALGKSAFLPSFRNCCAVVGCDCSVSWEETLASPVFAKIAISGAH